MLLFVVFVFVFIKIKRRREIEHERYPRFTIEGGVFVEVERADVVVVVVRCVVRCEMIVAKCVDASSPSSRLSRCACALREETER